MNDADAISAVREEAAETIPAPPAPVQPQQENANLADAVRAWDQQNRIRRSDAWFEGARLNEQARAGFSDALNAGGDQVQAHGMAKEATLTGAVRNLMGLLQNGLDINRRGGKLDTAALVAGDANASGGTTASGGAYSDGPFMLVARPGQELSGNLSGLGAVLVNESHAEIVPALREAIRAIRPDIVVESYSNAGTVVRQLNGKTSAPVVASETPSGETQTPLPSTDETQPTETKGASDGQVQGQAEEVATTPEDRVAKKQDITHGDAWDLMSPAIRGVVTTDYYDGKRSDALKKWSEIPEVRREAYKKAMPIQNKPGGYSYLPPGYVREGDRYVFKGEQAPAPKTSKQIFTEKRDAELAKKEAAQTPPVPENAGAAGTISDGARLEQMNEARRRDFRAKYTVGETKPHDVSMRSRGLITDVSKPSDALVGAIRSGKKSADYNASVFVLDGTTYRAEKKGNWIKVFEGETDMGPMVATLDPVDIANKPKITGDVPQSQTISANKPGSTPTGQTQAPPASEAVSSPVAARPESAKEPISKGGASISKPTSKQIFEQKRSKAQTQKTVMIDDATDAHFSEWLNKNVADSERQAVDNGIRAYIAKNPDVITKKNWSWPEVKAVAKREGYIKEAPATAPASKVVVEQKPSGEKVVSVPSKDSAKIAPSEQKRFFLAEIDKAIETAPDEAKPTEGWTKEDDARLKEADKAENKARSEWNKVANDGTPEEKNALVALKKANDVASELRRQKARKSSEHVTIEVPGDGTFTVLNTKDNLRAVQKKMASAFNKPGANTPSLPSGRATPIPKVEQRPPSMNKSLWDKILEPFTPQGKDNKKARGKLATPWYDKAKGEGYATDSRRAVFVTGLKISEPKAKKPLDRPLMSQVVPGYRAGQLPDVSKSHESVKIADTEAFARKLHQAYALVKETKSVNELVVLYRMKDGTVAIEAKDPEIGEYQSGDVKKGKAIGAYNIPFLLDAVEFMRKTGNAEAVLHYVDDTSPLLITGAKEYVVQMPIRRASLPMEDMEAAPQMTEAKRRSLLTKMGQRYGKYAAFSLNKDGSFTMTAKRTGARIRVEAVKSLPKNEAGLWSPSRRTIQIANTEEIGHELTHAMRDMGMISDFEWLRLTKLAKQAKADSIEQIKARYAARKYNLTEDGLNHELVAMYVNDVAEGRIDAGEGRTLVQKVLDFFRELARTLGVGAGSDVGLVRRTAEGAQMGLPGAARTGTMRGMKDRLAAQPQDPRDAEYLAAVERGDMETAQRIVDAAAKKNIYDAVRAAKLELDSQSEKINSIPVNWDFEDRQEENQKLWYPNPVLPERLEALEEFAPRDTIEEVDGKYELGEIPTLYDSLDDAKAAYDAKLREWAKESDTSGSFGQSMSGHEVASSIFDAFPQHPSIVQEWGDTKWGSWYLRFRDRDGVIRKISVRDHGASRKDIGLPDKSFVVDKSWNPEEVGSALLKAWKYIQEESADAIVRDDQGRVIPPSERFQSGNPDIRYSLGTDYATAKAEKTDEGWTLKDADGTVIKAGFTSKRHADTYARLKSGAYLDAGVMATERRGKTVYGIRVQNSKGKYVYDGHFFPTEEMAYTVLSHRQAALDEAVEFLVGKDADKVVTVAEARKKLFNALADQIEAGENADKVKADAADAIKALVRSLGKDIDVKTLRPLSEKVYAMLTDKKMSSVERRMGAINNFITGIVLERARRSVRKDMDGMMDGAIKPKKDSKTLQLKDPDLRYAINAVNHVRARADWTLEQIEQENEALLDSSQNNEMKPDDGQPPTVVGADELTNEDKVALNLNFAGYGIEMDFTRLAEMRENLETLMGDKASKARQEREAKKQYFENEAEEYRKMLGGDRKGNALENNEHAAPMREKLKKLLLGFHGNIMSGQYSLEMLDQEKNVDPTNRKNVSVERMEHASRSKEAEGMDPPREAVQDILAGAFGLNPKNKIGDRLKFVRKLTELKKFQKDTGVFAYYPKTDEKGKIVRDEEGKIAEIVKGEKAMSGSRENFIYMYALKRRAESEAGQTFSNDPMKVEGYNHSLMRRLVKNGYSERTMDQIEDYIGQEGIAIAEGLNKWVQENVSPKVRRILIKKYGIAPAMFDFYVPIANKIVKGDQDITGGAVAGMDKMVYGWMKRASFNQFDFKPSSIIDLYMKHMAEVNHVDAWHDTVEYERRVFKNAKLQAAINNVLGDKFRRHLNEHVKRISMGSEAMMHSQFENWFIRKFSVSVIHNPTQFFKQAAAAPMPLAFAPPGASKTAMFAKGTANMILNLPSRFRWAQMMFRESPVFRDRYEKGMNIPMRISESTKHGDMVKTLSLRSFFHWMTNFTKYGDMTSAIWAGPELYQSWYDYAKKQGMSDADAKKEAIFRVDQAIEKGLQSSHSEHMSSAQTGHVQKFFQLFNTQQVAMTRKWVSTWRDILKGRGSKLDNASKLVAIHLSQAMWQLMADALGAGLTGDDGEDEWERMKHNQFRTSLLLPIGGYAVTYSLLERLLKQWQKEPVMGEFFGDAVPSSAPFETMSTVASILARFLNGELTEADMNRLYNAGAELAGVALGTPVAPALRWGKGIADASTNPDLSRSQRVARGFGYGKMAVGEKTAKASAKPKKSSGLFDAYRPATNAYQYKNPYSR